MTTDVFFSAIKSTIDNVSYAIAASLVAEGETTLQVADLDDVMQTDAVLGAEAPALVYQLLEAVEAPRDPLWVVSFLIGVKTTSDASNYKLSTLQAKITSRFPVGSSLDIRNYFANTLPSTSEAHGTVVAAEINPQQFDAQSGIRLTKIRLAVVRQ